MLLFINGINGIDFVDMMKYTAFFFFNHHHLAVRYEIIAEFDDAFKNSKSPFQTAPFLS